MKFPKKTKWKLNLQIFCHHFSLLKNCLHTPTTLILLDLSDPLSYQMSQLNRMRSKQLPTVHVGQISIWLKWLALTWMPVSFIPCPSLAWSDVFDIDLDLPSPADLPLCVFSEALN